MVRVTSRSGRMSEKWSRRPDDFPESLDQVLPEAVLFSFVSHVCLKPVMAGFPVPYNIEQFLTCRGTQGWIMKVFIFCTREFERYSLRIDNMV